MQLYLARHGETVWNAESRFQGWKGSALTEKGKAQVRAMAEFFKNKELDLVFSSDLPRAKTTAQEILHKKEGLVLETDQRLREMNFGSLEGKTWKEAIDAVPSLFMMRRLDAFEIDKPSGESFGELRERVNEFLEEKIFPEKDSGKKILIISHDGTMRTILQIIFGIPDNERAGMGTPHETVYNIDFSGDRKNCSNFDLSTGNETPGFHFSAGR